MGTGIEGVDEEIGGCEMNAVETGGRNTTLLIGRTRNEENSLNSTLYNVGIFESAGSQS